MKNTNEMYDEHKTSDNKKADHLLNTESSNIKLEEVFDVFNKVSATLEEAGQWSKSTAQLFFMEIRRNILAARGVVFCQLLFIPLLILFILSLCISTGVVAYALTFNIILSFSIFLFSMFCVLLGLLYWQKRLVRFLGFTETLKQLQEGMDVITKASKSTD